MDENQKKIAEGDTPTLQPLADDLIWEVGNISRLIGRTERQTFHLLSSGVLPAKKIGGRWVASRRKLLEALLGDAA